jgi:toxin FitB
MIILDTNVLSELMRPLPDPAVQAWADGLSAGRMHTTSVTEGEIFYGLYLLPEGERRMRLMNTAELLFKDRLNHQVLAFDRAAARAYAVLRSHRHQMGQPVREADMQIAAIAQVNQALLATRNTRDFLHCGLTLINPWDTTP